MANKFTYQVLRDSTTDVVIKLTGQFDGASGNETANNIKVVANSFYGALDANSVPLRSSLSVSNTPLPYYNLQLTSAQYFVSMSTASPPGSVELYWVGNNNSTANNATIFYLNGNGEYGSQQQPAILNNAIGPNGNLGISTYGATANTAYTIILSLRKDNAHYQRGQFNDPAAFNYGQYSLKP
jgi:hypothetical protein